jgi:hypothetical protein
MRGHANDDTRGAPFFDQGGYRCVVYTIGSIGDYAQRARGACYILTYCDADATPSEVESQNCSV